MTLEIRENKTQDNYSHHNYHPDNYHLDNYLLEQKPPRTTTLRQLSPDNYS